VDIPKDVQNWIGPFKGHGRLPVRGYRERMHQLISSELSADKCKQFYDALTQAKRPLIYAGGGVVNGEAAEAMCEFADAFGIPVVTTLMGIGAYDTSRERALHMLGMHGTAFANYATDDADFLIALGARFDDRVAAVPDKFGPNAKYIAHFDIDPSEIDKVKSVHWHHVGLMPESLNHLLSYGKDTYDFKADYSEWHQHVADLKSTYAMNYDKESETIQPYAVIEEINKYTKGEAIVSTGVGQHQMWAAQYFDFAKPRLWLTSGSMGTMGLDCRQLLAHNLPNHNRWLSILMVMPVFA
jgi:acetolactate synthase-1/2/3 large subunit